MFNPGYFDIGGYSSLAKLQRTSAISYDTSSKDPQMLRSRIFVGGLNTNTVTRDDVIQLFSSYGSIRGVTLFKGYAFVQYSSVSEADLAVSALNYYHWHGSALEVKTVAKDQKGTSSTSLSGTSTNGTFGKRPAQNDSSNGAKKGRPQSNVSMDAMVDGWSFGGAGYFDIGSYSSLAKLQRPSAISYDTSSKDPQMLRSRIFVGGLNTNTVTRDDVIQLFSSYGSILGVTLFKGYAFVQYSSVSEADLAISALNCYHWHGSALEVKTVAKDQNGVKKDHPLSMDATVESLNEFNDLLICGVCRFTTRHLEAFIAHRKSQCDVKTAGKSEEEPEERVRRSRSCDATFVTCWGLVEQLGASHNLSVYNKQAASTAATSAVSAVKVEEAE